ncbi:MAG: SGNH/GDSL hydrolase family protein [Afipia sp.]|mgnify:CR=1 FL=1|nr:SGNH/GDSL hydrolase family protein [Afipia sp.]
MNFDCRFAAAVAIALVAGMFAPGTVFAQSAASDAATKSDAPMPQKGLATKAIEAAKSAASTASDILTRVPCLPAKGLKETPGALPHVAQRIAAGDPVTIVAFGSSTTVGYGTTSTAYTYPNRLADQLRRAFPTSDITIINRGMGGQDVPDMMKRFDAAVLDANPGLVIWQLGTNLVIKGSESEVAASAAMVEDGIARLQARGVDVVLIDPQYVPAVTAKEDNANSMVKLIGQVAKLKNVSVFPRFEIMRQWHQDEKLPFDKFVIGDGLHMNDWGYACFAQLLGDTIIASVGQVKAGINVPSNVMTFRPM